MELNDLNVETSLIASHDKSLFQTAFQSGWNRLRLPQLPQDWRLHKISSFSASLTGLLPYVSEDPAAMEGLETQWRRGREAASSFPLNLDFRMSGTWPPQPESPLFQLMSRANKGIRIGQIKSQLDQLDLVGSTLNSLNISSTLSQVQTLERQGGLFVDTATQIRGDTTRLAASIRSGHSSSPLSFELLEQGGALDFHLARDLELSSFLPGLNPFLAHVGLSLDGLDIKARVTGLNVKGIFKDRELDGISGTARIASGPLASLDLAKVLPSPRPRLFERLDLSLSDRTTDSSTGMRFEFSVPEIRKNDGTAQVSADINGLHLTALDHDRKVHRLDLKASSLAEFAFFRGNEQPANVIGQQLVSLTRDLAEHAHRARNLLAAQRVPSSKLPFRDLDFDLRLENFPRQSPFLVIDPEVVSLNLQGNVGKLSWNSEISEPSSKFSGLSTLALKLGVHQDHLVVDGTTTTDSRISSAGQPERLLRFQFPFLLATRDHLVPRQEGLKICGIARITKVSGVHTHMLRQRDPGFNPGVRPTCFSARFLSRISSCFRKVFNSPWVMPAPCNFTYL